MLDTHLVRSLLVALGGSGEQKARVALTEIKSSSRWITHWMRVFIPGVFLSEYISLDVGDGPHDDGPQRHECSQLGLEKENPSRPWSSLHSLQ